MENDYGDGENGEKEECYRNWWYTGPHSSRLEIWGGREGVIPDIVTSVRKKL